MNKQSNIYTIIYIIVVVVIVSAALSITATALKPKQTANANADKMRQILFSIGVAPQSNDVIATFGKTITEQLL
ncbi:MAG: Na(+)-translocating NADH-quinone reductase subunit C, partial [Muribaculaceae bacterium]|nr:Na(+)-translocating NADH-quinone reductase subunit C [Muribaculaceae bacterium]